MIYASRMKRNGYHSIFSRSENISYGVSRISCLRSRYIISQRDISLTHKFTLDLPLTVHSVMRCFFHFIHLLVLTILPQAIFSPEFPDGWVVKSSGEPRMITVLPITSSTENLSVRKDKNAMPPTTNKGGISPA